MDEPVDLTPLMEDVESPDLVRRSFKKFRRRVLMFVALPLVVAVIAVGVVLYFTIRPLQNTQTRIERASQDFAATLEFQTDLIEVGDFEVIVLDAARLRPGWGQRALDALFQREHRGKEPVGLHLVVRAPAKYRNEDVAIRPRDRSEVENDVFADSPSIGSSSQGSPITEFWLILNPEDGDIDLALEVTERQEAPSGVRPPPSPTEPEVLEQLRFSIKHR
jgi:hypothetical protein